MRLTRFRIRRLMAAVARHPVWNYPVRPPRFRIRTLMVAVAVAAILIAYTEARWRALGQARMNSARARLADQQRRVLLEKLRYTDLNVEATKLYIPVLERKIADAEQRGSNVKLRRGETLRETLSKGHEYVVRSEHATDSMKARLLRLSAIERHYAQLAAKYEDAARHPWLPVPPDPPEPK